MKERKFDFDDILIEPIKSSSVRSRTEINNRYGFFSLPIFTAPMDTVVNDKNYKDFLNNSINVCLPRGEKGDENCFQSFSLNGIKELIDTLYPKGKYLIDMANGHMEELVTVTQEIKTLYPECTLMVGNVANPKTYKLLSNAGADYVRIGVGNGNGCLTTVQLGIGYPMGSLIKECSTIGEMLDNPAKIVADGGMKKYSDIIKALAIGADYVMVGSLLNKTLESSGNNFLFNKIKISERLAKYLYKFNMPIYKKFRGMSTKEVQKSWGNKILKTSEGVVRYRRVEYTLEQWKTNFDDYLKSAMSYTNSKNLNEFIGVVKYNHITENAFKRFNK